METYIDILKLTKDSASDFFMICEETRKVVGKDSVYTWRFQRLLLTLVFYWQIKIKTNRNSGLKVMLFSSSSVWNYIYLCMLICPNKIFSYRYIIRSILGIFSKHASTRQSRCTSPSLCYFDNTPGFNTSTAALLEAPIFSLTNLD
jgi:hypothetical protein